MLSLIHISTNDTASWFYDLDISTRAPREGSDQAQRQRALCAVHFYPRSPRGERPVGFFYFALPFGISTRAPREGSDFNV